MAHPPPPVKAPRDSVSKHDAKALQIQLNRLYSKKAAIETKLKTTAKAKRMSRTRTLIQLGGLVQKSGLMELCEITEGDDLQGNLESHDKAAVLLGILSEATESLLSLGEDALKSHLSSLQKNGKKFWG